MTTKLLHEAIRAIKSGDKATGKQKLYQVIQNAPQSREAEQAWLWMTRVVSNPKQKIQCLETALELNPDNQSAQKGLAILKRRLAAAQAPQQTTRTLPSTATQTAMDTEGSGQTDINSDNNSLTIDLTSVEAPLVLGMLGSLLLALGVFAPIITMPIFGQLNIFDKGSPVGVALIILAVAVLILAIAKQYKWIWTPGLPAFTMVVSILIALLRILASMRQATQETDVDSLGGALAEAFADMLLETIRIEWGWIILLLAVVSIVSTPLLHKSSRRAPVPILSGVILSVIAFASLHLSDETLTNFSLGDTAVLEGMGLGAEDTTSGTEALPETVIPPGDPIDYEGNTLRVLQVHNPTGFAVVEYSLFGYEPVAPIEGTHFLTIEFEFTCGAEDDVICDLVPEASLSLLLADGKEVSDEWQLLDAANLGEEDIASGKSTTGWVVFRVPDTTSVAELIVDPFGDSALRAALPAPRDGIQLTHSWERYSSDTEMKIEPQLRQALRNAGISTGYVFHMRGGDDPYLAINICEETTYSFGQDEIIQNHHRLILDALELAAPYTSPDENVGLIFNECEDTPLFEFTVIATYDELLQWSQRRLHDADFLDRLYATEN